MAQIPKYHRSIRLPGYDYTQSGAYFVTLVTSQRLCLFGKINGETCDLSNTGKIALAEWTRLPQRFAYVNLDELIIMPNHVHGILFLQPDDSVAARRDDPGSTPMLSASPVPEVENIPRRSGVQPRSLGAVIGAYKSSVTLRVNYTKEQQGRSLWQRNYYEHVISDDAELQHLRQYIIENPIRWAIDKENPE